MKANHLQLQQLNNKIKGYQNLKGTVMPPTGWLKAIRTSIGMSLEQLGNKLGIAKQNVQALEKRELAGTVSLKTLREAAEALEMELVYGFVPKDGTLDALIDRRAKEVATTIVLRAAQTMALEDQANSGERLIQAIEERAREIKENNIKLLWD
jgi:predicted DNA-binding mobile mystery protein A